MDEEALNQSIRRFLKMVGIRSQREIEQAVAKGLAERAISEKDTPFPATMRLHVESLGIDVTFDGEIDLAPRAPASGGDR
ncbi:MAG: hypothetical protein HS109_08080 [Burkholderiales bacterium]|nr:hypothetical protein [Burkholderiales bacterium]MCE7876977.1 hypothetical protein [Betaproteobacteria bacterium PRO3]